MAKLSRYLNPFNYARALRRVLHGIQNARGVTYVYPGHFYSPLLDLVGIGRHETSMPNDGAEYWDCIDLRATEQQAYFSELLTHYPVIDFPPTETDGFRFYTVNDWFPHSDAITLSAILQKEKPRIIIEVGSGFSTAVMLDTIDRAKLTTSVKCIEPDPARLRSLLSEADLSNIQLTPRLVQDVDLSFFDQLEKGDMLFIDSSHVAKIGSDVTHILLRILPRLKSGVIVHFHDIIYPATYPIEWIRQGRAWNESLFLRAFLTCNNDFEVLAFNSFAGQTFPAIFANRCECFSKHSGGSIWLKKTANSEVASRK